MANPCTLKPEVARARMMALDVTQAALAADCGIDVRTLQRWFAGQRVSLRNAERLASALGLGTAELFDGAPDDGSAAVLSRLRLVQRLLSARDSAFAQGFRLLREHFDIVLHAVSFSAHPTRGFVVRPAWGAVPVHSFASFRLACAAEHADIVLRCQLGRTFSYVVARLRLRGAHAYLVETFQTNSMRADRSDDGSLVIWYWVGPEHRELILVSDEEVSVSQARSDGTQELVLGGPDTEHVLCVRPNAVHLKAAGLPMGFDRIRGPREGRVDVPMHWETLARRACAA